MRIASLQPSVSIILDRLGCLDAPDGSVALVACTRYCLEALPSLRERGISVIQDSWSTSAGELLAVRPDLVIASVPYRRESLEAILKAGCPVLALAPHSLADIEQDIRLIAAVAGAPARGEAIVAEMRAAIDQVRRRTAPLTPKPLVYSEEWGKPPIHSQLWVRELVEAAGGIFVGEPGAATTFEAVASADPDVVIASWCGAGDRVPLDKIAARPGWESMRAVRESRIACIADELLNTPAPTLVAGLEALAAALHPAHFPAAEGLRWLSPHRTTVPCV